MRIKKGDVRESLIEQLKEKGADVACFSDLIEDYMKLWNIKNKLVTDINKRGVVYEDVSSVGITMKKNNPSVKEIVNVNRQMLSILEKLGISTEKCVASGDDDADL